jgi:hypothetical protein
MKEIRKNSFVALALAFCMTGAMPLSFSAKAEAKAVQNSYDKIKNVTIVESVICPLLFILPLLTRNTDIVG